MKVIFLSLELSGGVDLGRADLLDGHLHVVHPLHHLGVPDVIIIIDMTVILMVLYTELSTNLRNARRRPPIDS